MKENSFLIQRKLQKKNKIWENNFFNTFEYKNKVGNE